MNRYGISNTYDPIFRVIVRSPTEAFSIDNPGLWNYSSIPDLKIAQKEHEQLTNVLIQFGIDVIFHQESLPEHADSVFVFDPALMTPEGAVLLHMGKELRRGEERAMSSLLENLGIPILSTLKHPATAEGGDILWLDSHTLALGQGFRTNPEALKQLGQALLPQGISVIPVELPYFYGPKACLHLLSLISILDKNLAVTYLPLLPVSFVLRLKDLDLELVEVPPEEFLTMGPNVLAIGPKKCLMLEGNPVTQRRLEAAGCEVFTYVGKELSLKAEGGPTCLTFPILRGK